MSVKVIVSQHENGQGSVRSYCFGFGLSIGLTLAAYLVAVQHLAHGWALVFLLATLAIIQLFVQLVFFLHMGHESKPRWNLSALLFAAMVVFIVVFGSLWIMKNLAYNHAPQPSSNDIIKDEGYHP